MFSWSSWGREHHSSKPTNSNRTATTVLEPKYFKTPSPKSQSQFLPPPLNELLLHYHYLRCSSKIFLKSWVFWHLPYVFPVFIFGSAGKKKKHLQFWMCRLSNTQEEITTGVVWLPVCWPVLLFFNCQHFQIHQTDSFFVPIQTTSNFL